MAKVQQDSNRRPLRFAVQHTYKSIISEMQPIINMSFMCSFCREVHVDMATTYVSR